MPTWGNEDAATNSPSWATSYVNLPANSANRAALYGNTTAEAFTNAGNAMKKKIGTFGVDTTEIAVSNASVSDIVITNPGSGYAANAAVTVGESPSTNATANAQSNSTGRIATVHVNTAGDGYLSAPSITIAAPAAQTFNSNTSLYVSATFNANSGVDEDDDTIAISSQPFSVNDAIVYTVAAGNTAVDPLANATTYYVTYSNSTVIAVANTLGGANLELTKSVTETGHTFTMTTGFIEIGSNVLQVGDAVTYLVAAGNTEITELSNGTTYYVVTSNSTGVKLATAPGGTALELTPGVSEAGHSLTGETATAVAALTGVGSSFGAHAGWVLRTVGTGGRAGRVTYETLVAMGSMTGDGSDDAILKDS